MNAAPIFRMETLLAGLLRYGTWVASLVIAIGLALDVRGASHGGPGYVAGSEVVTVGIALFILLPVLRVALMLIIFVRERDYRFVTFSATVLTIILTGFAIGHYMAKSL